MKMTKLAPTPQRTAPVLSTLLLYLLAGCGGNTTKTPLPQQQPPPPPNTAPQVLGANYNTPTGDGSSQPNNPLQPDGTLRDRPELITCHPPFPNQPSRIMYPVVQGGIPPIVYGTSATPQNAPGFILNDQTGQISITPPCTSIGTQYTVAINAVGSDGKPSNSMLITVQTTQ